MSCDTSDPKILEAYHDLQSGTETDWLLLSYLANSPNHDVVLDKTGSGGVAGLRSAIGSSNEEVLFGLVRVQGHELLVTFVAESVVGVRRARTIVHSRAIAKLFPDHHSTLTISHASELSDSATTERLNLDEAHLQQVRAHHRAVSNGSTIRSRVGADEGVATQLSNRSLKADQQEVLHNDELPSLPAPSPPRSPAPLPVAAAAVPTAGLASMELGPPISSHPRAVSHSQAPPLHHPSPIQIDQRRVVSSSALPPSPTTPNSSRFKNMIPKFARRRRRSSSSQTGSQPGSIPNSPIPAQNGFASTSNGNGYPAPPVPPKESPVSTGFVPPMNRQAFPTHPPPSATEEAQAAEALHSVRQRSISMEKETQDRFRREKLGYGHPSSSTPTPGADRQLSMDAESEGGGLPYDRDDHVPLQAQAQSVAEQQQGLSTLTEVTSSTSLSREAADAAAAERLAAAAEAHAERVAAEREREEAEMKREVEERDRLEKERVEELERIERKALAERERVLEAERVQAERVQAEAERVRIEEEERIGLQAETEERERLQKEERERAEAEAKRAALEEAEEKKRKVSESLENQFRQGGTLLSGWITVQSPHSMAWRRRWFKLQPTVLELFKVETDPSTIGTIPLNSTTSLSIWYEESQVKDSFKLSCESDDYFLFADSKEDFEVVIQGLGVTGISVNRRE